MEHNNKAWFKYAGKNSLEMGLSVSINTTKASPEYDLTFVEVLGRNGDLTVDNERLKSFVYPIHVILESEWDVERTASEVSEWLKEDVRYKPLELSWDSGYTYQAIFFEQYEISEMLPLFGKVALNFRVHPVKYRTDSLDPLKVSSGEGLYNPEKRPSKPLIEVEAVGDVTIRNNGEEWLVLRGVDGSISVDSELQSVYKGSRNQFSKMASGLSPLFPELSSGENLITWSGNVTKLEITPRWEAVS